MFTVDNSQVEKYIDEVCSLVKNKKVHESIRIELRGHIEELISDYIDVGIDEPEAIKKAVAQMGSAEIVGHDLNKVHKARPDWMLISISSIFILIGILTMSHISKGGLLLRAGYDNILSRTIVYGVSGVVITFILLKFHYGSLKKYSRYIYSGSIALLILTTYGGVPVFGRSYLYVGGIAIDSFTIGAFFLIVSLAGMFDNWNWGSLKGIVKGFIIAFLPTLFFILGNSTSILIIYFIAIISLMIVSGLRIKYVMVSLGGIAALLLGFLLSAPYRIERFIDIINPRDSTLQYLYNSIHSLISSAGFLGKGQKITSAMLPEAHTDFVLTYIIYAFGWIAGIILISLVIAFIVRIGFVAKGTKDRYGKLLVSGIFAMFTVQFILSISTSLAITLYPVVNMPFISYGGTNLIINILSVGIVSNVYKWRNTPLIKEVKCKV